MIYKKHIDDISKSIIDLYSRSHINSNDIQVQETRKEFQGDYTIVIFPLLKYSHKNIESTCSELGEYLVENLEYISSFNIIKGFLNLQFTDSFWFHGLAFSFSSKFEINDKTNKHIILESSSPNTNKPLHLGHLRNILLGHAVANILIADGNNVTKVQIINDRGIHICKSMVAWQKYSNGETPLSAKIKGDILVGKYYVLFEKKYQEEIKKMIDEGLTVDEASSSSMLLQEAKDMLKKWEDGDLEIIKLWKKMNSWVYSGFDKTYKMIGIQFDKNYYESDTYLIGKEHVLNGLNDKIFTQDADQSIWVNLEEQKIDKKLLLRSDGTAVYITQDIGTAILRYNDFNFDEMIYVVGNEQNHHFNVLFSILKKMNFKWSQYLHHLSYGMVNLPDGRMKSREGTVIDIDDLLVEMYDNSKEMIINSGKSDFSSINHLSKIIGDAALKYFILKIDAKKDILFNPQESIDFHGHTGPFIQYTFARINSILYKAGDFNQTFDVNRKLIKEEISIIKIILNYPIIIHQSASALNPSILANYLYYLSKEYNHFYQKIPILNIKNKNDINFRVTLSSKVNELIKKGMNLLGIEVPSKM
ncbi:arginine--tRNA ligase [Flavobacteriales bacterium]|nr:arginine--tRNA ligase [Flavobacteriales bacterium]